eukprot:361455-Chlamydomonas_euryale.AAC.4
MRSPYRAVVATSKRGAFVKQRTQSDSVLEASASAAARQALHFTTLAARRHYVREGACTWPVRHRCAGCGNIITCNMYGPTLPGI